MTTDTPTHLATGFCTTRGCTEPECIENYSTYLYELREDRATRINDEVPPERHGLNQTYVNWKCRCADCKNAHADYERNRRANAANARANI